MERIGYAIVEIATGSILAEASALPLAMTRDGANVSFDKPGLVAPDADKPLWKCVEIFSNKPEPGQILKTALYDFDGTRVNVAATFQYPPVSPEQVNVERDRRAAAPFIFDGNRYQSRIEDQKRINGAGTLALAAIVNGAQPGDYRWHGEANDFVWITADNKLVAMDAHTVIRFGKAAARWESAHVFAARALKDMTDIPRNFADNVYWPVAQ